MLKLVSFCIIIIISLTFSSCSENKGDNISNSEPSQELNNNENGIISDNAKNQESDGIETFLSVEIEPNEINIDEIPERIKIIVTNNSETEYYGGLEHIIEFFDGNDWIPLPVFDNVTTLALGINIKPNSSYELYDVGALSLRVYDFDFVPGKYRVNYDGFYGEFTII